MNKKRIWPAKHSHVINLEAPWSGKVVDCWDDKKICKVSLSCGGSIYINYTDLKYDSGYFYTSVSF
jgi:hypothetical protein